MPEIKVSTSADLRGFQDMQREMKTLIQQAHEYSGLMKTSGPSSSGAQRAGGTGAGVGSNGPGANYGGGPGSRSGSQAQASGAPRPPSGPPQLQRREIKIGERNPVFARARQHNLNSPSDTVSQGPRGRMGMGRHVQVPGSGVPPQYNLSTPGGVISYYENVLSQAAPMLNAMSGRNSGSGISNIAGVRYQPRTVQTQTQTTPVSARQMKDWFTGLGKDFSKMDVEIRSDYMNAVMRAGNSSALLPPSIKEFAKEYGTQLGAPTPKTVTTSTTAQQTLMQRLGTHFTNNMGKRGLGSALMGGLKGAIGGTAIDALAGGGTAGAVAGGVGAGVIGDLAGGPVGAVVAMVGAAIVKGIGSQLNQGMKSFTDTIPAFSQLSHALFNAKNSAVGFQQSIQMAGARVAMTPIQSTQTAQTLAGVFGRSTNIRNLVQQTGANAILNGLSPSAQAAMIATAGQLGITNGVGASMSPTQYNKMFLNMVQQSGMQGRQGSLGTGLLSIYSQLGQTNPVITSANSTAAIYAQMNATGVQGLQGQAGANIINQANAALANPQGITQYTGFAAINQASHGKITNPFQMESIMGQGLGAKIPGTNITMGQAYVKMAKNMGGGNIYNEAGYLAANAHISINDALEVLKTGSWTASSISEKNNQKTRLTISEQNTSAAARVQLVGSKLGYIKSLLNNVGARVAGGSEYVNSSGINGNIYTGNITGNQPKLPKSMGGLDSLLTLPNTPPSLSKSQLGFVKTVQPYALMVSQKTGIPAASIVGQWALESTWGTSKVAKLNANLAGIESSGLYPGGRVSKFAGFANLSQFAAADIETLNQKRYAGARELAKKGASVQDIYTALAKEGYVGPPTTPQQYGTSVAGTTEMVVKIDQSSVDALAAGIARELMHKGVAVH